MDKMNSPRFEHEGVEDLPQEATEFTTVIAPENGDEDSPITPKSIPILPLRDTVVFPEDIVPLAVGQSRSVKLIDLSLIHISEPTRLRRISYAVFCLKKKK